MPARADKTLMIMVDYWGQRNQTDTIINLKVFQPSSEISYLGGPPPSPVLTKAYETERYGWWYALPNFNPDNYGQGRVRFNTSYSRGWYQNDSTYRAAAGDTIHLSDTATSFTYQNTRTGVSSTVALGATLPKIFVMPDAGTYRGPKLYQAAGNSETQLLNMRGTDAKGNVLPGAIDKCMDAIPQDTVWIRWGTPANPPGQQPMEADMQCTGYNPFSVRYSQVYLRNPWPGADQPVVEFNGQDINLYPSSNPDWLVADLRYLPTQSTPSGIIRFKKGSGSGSYFDSAGLDQAISMPFHVAGTGASAWFVPSEAGGGIVTGKGALPSPKYTLYVQNPWKPGSPRLEWEDDMNLHVMRPTESCGWYKYPLYAIPKRILIGHSFEDSSYGTKGSQFRTRSNWIDILASAMNAKNEFWIQTKDASDNRIPAFANPTPNAKSCANDSIKLVMEAFDYKGRGVAGGNPAFQVGTLTGTGSCGLSKGLVKSTLDTNGLPIWSGRDTGTIGTRCGLDDAINPHISTPSNWFDTVALKAKKIDVGHTCVEIQLPKTASDSGYYRYNNDTFFPLDTISDQRGVSLYKSDAVAPNDGKDHNFLFCMHGHAAFEYTPGLKFQFTGDDDVWVFINNKLAVDLGGQHSPQSASVNLDKLKLREGSVYPFDIFYCERQTNQSHILIRTTMDLQPSWKYQAKPSSTGGSISVDILGQQSTNYIPSCADLVKAAPTWVKTTGRMVVVGPPGSNLSEGYGSDTILYNGNLSFSNGTIKLDTSKLKLETSLSWPGTYTIRIESRLGDSLYAIKFTKMYGAVVIAGTVFDSNGDGVADSVRLVAPRPVFGDNPSYHLAWFNAAGQRDSVFPTPAQVRKVSDSIVVAPLSGKNWGRRTEIPNGVRADSIGVVLSFPAGVATAVVNRIKLSDGIAPYADSARLLFGTQGASDTLRIWVNELASQNSQPAAGDLWAKVGTRSNPRGVSPVSATVMPGGIGIELILPAGHGVGSSDSVRIAGMVVDGSGNSAENSSIWVPVRSSALGTAFLFDANGDGRADSIRVELKGSLSTAKKVVVSWKNMDGTPVTRTWPVTPASPSFGTRVTTIADAFPFGATTCNGCTATFQDATGASVGVWDLLDSVAPVAIRGRYTFGTTTDTLRVRFSEPLKSSSGTGSWVQVGSGSTFRPVAASKTDLVGNSDSAVLLIDVASAIKTGEDSVRMVVLPGSSLLADLRGIKPGANSPWAPLSFGLPPMEAVLLDPNGVGKATDVHVKPLRSVPAGALTSLSSGQVAWSTVAGSPDSRTIPKTKLTTTSWGWSGTFDTPFDYGATACASCVGQVLSTDGSGNILNSVDSIAPVILAAKYRFSAGGMPDTVIVGLSEPWPTTSGASPNQAIVHVGTRSRDSVLSMVDWILSANGIELTMAVDTSVGQWLSVGDSVRLAGGSAARVRDAATNQPGTIAPWVPLQFGLRPATVRISVFHGLTLNGKTGGPAWKEPGPGIPKVELLLGSDTGWVAINSQMEMNDDGSIRRAEASQHDTAQVLGGLIRTNRPFTGTLIIYDRMGTAVLSHDLADIRKIWPVGHDDIMRQVLVTWDGRGSNGKFVADGIYLMRLVVKVEQGDGKSTIRNILWKLGWKKFK